jgi:hypothetical protein
MQQGNLTLCRGDDTVLGLTITNPDGSAYNLSGCYITFNARANGNYFSPVILTEQTGPTGHLSAVSGLSQLTFAAADTSGINDVARYYDIKLLSALNTTTTLIYGSFQLAPL